MTRRKQGRWLLKRVGFGFAVAVGLMGGDFDWDLPHGFPRPVIPADNLMSVAKDHASLSQKPIRRKNSGSHSRQHHGARRRARRKEQLALKKGDKVTVVIKSIEVMLEMD
jgi:hypothetical protein